jgi:hypothetical protein
MERIKMIQEIVKYSGLYKTNDLLFKSENEIDDIYYACLIPILKSFKLFNEEENTY